MVDTDMQAVHQTMVIRWSASVIRSLSPLKLANLPTDGAEGQRCATCSGRSPRANDFLQGTGGLISGERCLLQRGDSQSVSAANPCFASSQWGKNHRQDLDDEFDRNR